jgi:hypothetical protein
MHWAGRSTRRRGAAAALLSLVGLGSASCVYDGPTRFVEDVVEARAKEDLACAEPVRLRKTVSGFSAEGCGRRVVYGEVDCSKPYRRTVSACQAKRVGWTIPRRGFEETYTQRLVPVSQTVRDEASYGGEDFSGAEAVDAAAFLSRINARGAYDLTCPRRDVVPYLLPAGCQSFPRTVPAGRGSSMFLFTTCGHDIPVAEGCGRRAVYLPDDVLYLWSISATDEP